MQELIKKLTDTAGLTEEQAKKAVETVSSYIKDRLPDSFKSQIDNLVNGGKLSEGVKSKMNEIMGDFREKTEDLIGDVRDKTEDIISEVKEKFSDIFSKKEDEKKQP